MRKVYAILTVQLCLTAANIGFIHTNEGAREFVMKNPSIHIICLVIALGCMCAIVCTGLGKRVPHNYILCAIFTLTEGYIIAGFTSVYPKENVIAAGLCTALVSIALTVYALYTKTDISVFIGMSFVVYLAMLPMCFIAAALSLDAVRIVYCCIGLILYSLFLIIDTKIICEKNKSFGGYEVEYDDYIICAMQLYLDIVMIFVYILSLLGAAGGD